MTLVTVCQCEHASHFDVPTMHVYGVERERDNVCVVVTSHGTFVICRACVTAGHMREGVQR